VGCYSGGGDFNLIRGADDKNNCNINWPRVHLFNDCIARLALREFRRSAARFTLANKQLNPMRSVLDRLFVSPEWESQFPIASPRVETRIGSDYTPCCLTLEKVFWSGLLYYYLKRVGCRYRASLILSKKIGRESLLPLGVER
jgi:hypothetical protein